MHRDESGAFVLFLVINSDSLSTLNQKEVLLPHIAASVSRALGCAIVDRGVCTVNGQLRDANAMDLDGLIKTSDRAMGNPNSIHYRSPYEGTDSDGEEGAEAAPTVVERKQIETLRNAVGSGSEATVDDRFGGSATVVGSSASTVDGRRPRTPDADHPNGPRTHNPSMMGSAVDASVSSVKTSVKPLRHRQFAKLFVAHTHHTKLPPFQGPLPNPFWL